MTFLAGLGISATGALVVFGALTGRLAAIIAAVIKPSDLASSGSYVNGIYDSGAQAATGGDASSLLIIQLEKQVQNNGLAQSTEWKTTVEPLVRKALATRKQSDYDAAIAALRQLLGRGQQAPAGAATGGVPRGA